MALGRLTHATLHSPRKRVLPVSAARDRHTRLPKACRSSVPCPAGLGTFDLPFADDNISVKSLYLGHRFPPEIISHAVWLYRGCTLSVNDLDDLLAERGVTVL